VNEINQAGWPAAADQDQDAPLGERQSAVDHVPAAAPVEISASIAQQITYATQQNDVAVIADLSLANHGEEAFEDLVLTLVVDPPLIAEKRWRIDRLAAGGELRLSGRDVSLEGAKLSRLREAFVGFQQYLYEN
jgi:hypothetical protein